MDYEPFYIITTPSVDLHRRPDGVRPVRHTQHTILTCNAMFCQDTDRFSCRKLDVISGSCLSIETP